jgi:BASS family bile acid:Na+ symporter
MVSDALAELDGVRLDFSNESLHLLNIAIALIMFGVALEIKVDDFKELLKNPKSAITGIFSQYLALPLLTFLLIIAFKSYLTPTVALGMILVSVCPGGNISNFISSMANGNLALSISLTAIATVAATIITPLNFALWGGWYIDIQTSGDAATLVRPLKIDVYQMFQTVFIILGIPIMAGIFFSYRFPSITRKILKPLKQLSILIFAVIVVMAIARNFDHFFLSAIKYVFFLVLLQNALAFITGYGLSSMVNLQLKDRKTISIETGIQNSGLALALIFNPKIFPPEMELGGMAIIAAMWGIWHILAGFIVAGYWSRFSFGLKTT